MSHFSVMVIGTGPEDQLAPYHEFECTGNDDQYVVEVDKTDEARAEYAKYTKTRYRDPDGVLHSPYTDEGDHDPRFWRDPTEEEAAKIGPGGGTGGGHGISWASADWKDGRGYRTRVRQLPEGWTETQVPASECQTFAEFVEDYYGVKAVPHGREPDTSSQAGGGDQPPHKYGYCLLDEAGGVAKVVDRTNPDKKWDWYELGGRWEGMLKLKDDRKHRGRRGRPGLQRMDPDYKAPEAGYVDQCRKGDIDVEAMRYEAGAKAAEEYGHFARVTEGLPAPATRPEMQKLHSRPATDEEKAADGFRPDRDDPVVDWDAARAAYHEQPAVKALAADEHTRWFEAGHFACGRDEYVERTRRDALRTFAVVKGGRWYEKGSMGWWGIVSDENDAWPRQFAEIFDSTDDDELVSVYDCHI